MTLLLSQNNELLYVNLSNTTNTLKKTNLTDWNKIVVHKQLYNRISDHHPVLNEKESIYDICTFNSESRLEQNRLHNLYSNKKSIPSGEVTCRESIRCTDIADHVFDNYLSKNNIFCGQELMSQILYNINNVCHYKMLDIGVRFAEESLDCNIGGLITIIPLVKFGFLGEERNIYYNHVTNETKKIIAQINTVLDRTTKKTFKIINVHFAVKYQYEDFNNLLNNIILKKNDILIGDFNLNIKNVLNFLNKKKINCFVQSSENNKDHILLIL
jgi:hypothetical protein